MDTLGKRLKYARTARGMTQTELAGISGVKQSDISKLERGDSQTTTNLLALARALQVRPDWLDTGDGEMDLNVLDRIEAKSYGHSLDAPETWRASLSPILSWDHPDVLPPGEFVVIPRLDVHLSAGDGHGQVEIELMKDRPQAFRADWIRRKQLKPAKLACMYAKGESMEPRIYDRDALVVDTSQTDVVDDGVYALWYDGGERVKRLFRRPGGGLTIKSDNPRHTTIELAPTEVEHVRIIGRVVQISSEGGL